MFKKITNFLTCSKKSRYNQSSGNPIANKEEIVILVSQTILGNVGKLFLIGFRLPSKEMPKLKIVNIANED